MNRFKCYNRYLNRCKNTRIICVYVHQEETDFPLRNNYRVKKNLHDKGKKHFHGELPFKKELEFKNLLDQYEFPIWIMRILRKNEYYDVNDIIKSIKTSNIVQNDIIVKFKKIKQTLEEFKDYEL